MGKFKTEKMRDWTTINKAKRMAEAFAENKTKLFLPKFLEDSGLASSFADSDTEKRDIKHWTESLTKTLDHAFGAQIALAYAMGYMDSDQKKTIKTLYVPGNGATNSTNEPIIEAPSSQLILPGMED